MNKRQEARPARKRAFCLGLGVLLLLAACGNALPADTLVVVNGEPITQGDIERDRMLGDYSARLYEAVREAYPAQAALIAQEWEGAGAADEAAMLAARIRVRVQAQKAQAKGYAVDTDVLRKTLLDNYALGQVAMDGMEDASAALLLAQEAFFEEYGMTYVQFLDGYLLERMAEQSLIRQLREEYLEEQENSIWSGNKTGEALWDAYVEELLGGAEVQYMTEDEQGGNKP